MNVFEELNKITEDQELLEKGYGGQGILCRTLIEILKLLNVNIPDRDDWVLHHKNGDHKDEKLGNLMIVTKADHSCYHGFKNRRNKQAFEDLAKDDYFYVGHEITKYIEQHTNELNAYENEASDNVDLSLV